jgi:glycosyltransferase involved in cell wall biosynthesis
MTLLFMCALALLPLVMTWRNLAEYRTPPRVTDRPKVSVLIPARNEELNIARACKAVLASEAVDLELIVLDDGSTDGTLQALGAILDPRLRVATAPPLPAGWCGKQHACHLLGMMAQNDWLIFVDADVRLEPDALNRMAGFLETTHAGLASGVPRQVLCSWSERLVLPLIHFLLLGYLPMALMRQRLDPRFGAGCGQLFIARRDAYLAVGGHAAIASSIHDGLALPRAFRRAGYASLLFDATCLSHCRMYANVAQVWEGLSKNATEAMARPLALPIWTIILGVGQVLPVVMLSLTHSVIAAIAVAAGIGTRLILAFRFRQPVLSTFLHPIGVSAVLIIQWFSLLRATFGGAATWRGRRYAAH